MKSLLFIIMDKAHLSFGLFHCWTIAFSIFYSIIAWLAHLIIGQLLLDIYIFVLCMYFLVWTEQGNSYAVSVK